MDYLNIFNKLNKAPMNESISTDDRVNALAKYLGINKDEIEEGYTDNFFETPEGDYLVLNEEEAIELAEEYSREIFKDMGLEGLTEYARDIVCSRFIDKDFIWSAIEEEIDYFSSEEESEDTLSNLEKIRDSEDFDGAVQWFVDLFGQEEFSKWIADRNAFDVDAIAEWCVDIDGVAHFLSSYDGNEVDLGNGLYAYRVN